MSDSTLLTDSMQNAPHTQPFDLETDVKSLREKLALFNPSSSADCLAMRPNIHTALEALNSYTAEMDRIVASYTKLAAERTELEKHYARAVWLCSPLSRLVPDVLREIFKHVTNTQQYSLEDHHSSPLRLTHVCRAWRSVAFAHTSLWASIKLQEHEYSDFNDNESGLEKAVKFHLERSGSSPLTIFIGSDNYAAMSLLNAERHRWRKCTTTASVYRYGDKKPPRYAALEELELRQRGGTVHFIDTPRLRSYSGPLDGTFLAWHQLTSVAITYGEVQLSKIVELLSYCVKLDSLRVDYPTNDIKSMPAAADTIPAYPRLRKVRLVCGNLNFKSVLLVFFSSFTAPALASLDICISCEAGKSKWSQNLTKVLSKFLSHSPALTALALKNMPIPVGSLRDLFACAPAVEHLVWWEMQNGYNRSNLSALCSTLHQLTSRGDGEELGRDVLPRLTRLEISGGLAKPRPLQHYPGYSRKNTDSSAEQPEPAKLIRSRAADGGKLRHVVLEYLRECDMDDDVREELRSLLESFVVREVVKKKRDVFQYDDSESEMGSGSEMDESEEYADDFSYYGSHMEGFGGMGGMYY